MSLLDEIKSAAEIIQKADNIELYRQILDIQNEALGLTEDIKVLKQENQDLKNKFKIAGELIFKDNAYYIADEQGNIKSGPYCSCCWDDKKKLIRMLERDNGWGSHIIECPLCGTAIR